MYANNHLFHTEIRNTFPIMGAYIEEYKRIPNRITFNKVINVKELIPFLDGEGFHEFHLDKFFNKNGVIETVLYKNSLKEAYVLIKTGLDEELYDTGILSADTTYSMEIYYSHKDLKKYFEAFEKFTVKDENKNKINIICDEHGLFLRTFELEKIDLDIDKNYNDDFKSVLELTEGELKKRGKKGLVLFHGKIGTGKTSIIRYLLSKIDRKIIFVPPDLAEHIASPRFITFMLEHKDSVLILEDSENILFKRGGQSSQACSNLLNISDGILGDVLSTSIIATFNTEIDKLDEALLRKGRIISRYEFKELQKEKAQILSDSLGFKTLITKDMTLAEVYNQDKPSFEEEKQPEKLGFR